jgi:hypothetical protein
MHIGLRPRVDWAGNEYIIHAASTRARQNFLSLVRLVTLVFKDALVSGDFGAPGARGSRVPYPLRPAIRLV